MADAYRAGIRSYAAGAIRTGLTTASGVGSHGDGLYASMSMEIAGALGDMIDRCKDLRPALEGWLRRLTQPGSYRRSDRFENDPLPWGGTGGGYRRHLRKPRRAKRRINLSFSRPFPPELTEATIMELAVDVGEYIVRGSMGAAAGRFA